MYTIGYEGRTKENLLDRLTHHRISLLVDVREIPISRKKGFSKTSLAQYLNDHGIEYVHVKALGSPAPLRNKLKSDHDYRHFFQEFSEYISTHAREEMKYVRDLAKNGENACLMCFEQDASLCHRSVIAKKIKDSAKRGISIKHL